MSGVAAPGGAPPLLGDLALRAPSLARGLAAVHGALLQSTRARLLATWFGAPVLVLETVGRRTGRPRAIPLVYLRSGDDLVVVPANAGADRPPAWWLNLQAAGEGVAVLGRERRRVVPAIAAGAERERLWRRLSAVAPLEHYQRRTRRALARRDPPDALTAGAVPRRRSRSWGGERALVKYAPGARRGHVWPAMTPSSTSAGSCAEWFHGRSW